MADGPRFHLTKSFTIEAWISVEYYAGSRQNHAFIVFRGDKREGFDPWYLCIEESGQLKFMITDLLNETSTVMSPAPLPTRRFFHVAAVLDNETGKQSLFVDGKRVATTKTSVRAGGLLGGTGAGVGIGGRQDTSHQGYRGSIAEVRITAEALTPSQFLLPVAE
ncbi:MAG: LamG domain-containing protein [Planctomycetota bacterium]|nr:LamG domain-containing protein [Planctomycetota bacterium]